MSEQAEAATTTTNELGTPTTPRTSVEAMIALRRSGLLGNNYGEKKSRFPNALDEGTLKFLLYLFFSCNPDRDKGVFMAWPGRRRIEDETGYSKSQQKKLTSKLVGKGLLSVDEPGDEDNDDQPNIYTLKFDKVAELAERRTQKRQASLADRKNRAIERAQKAQQRTEAQVA